MGISCQLATGDVTVQYTLDDVELTTYSASYAPSGGPTFDLSTATWWSIVSSTPYLTIPTTGSVGIHFNSSLIWPDGVSGTFLSPPCALRIYSTATSSCIMTLKAVQADGG